MKKILYFTTKVLYHIMIISYIFIPLSILFFDIIDFNGEYRKLICFIAIFVFIIFYILTVELPAIIFKVPVERYDMFSKKHNKKILSLLFNIVIILFLFETIIVVIISNKIMYYDALMFLLMLFFRVALRMSSIELKSIKAKI